MTMEADDDGEDGEEEEAQVGENGGDEATTTAAVRNGGRQMGMRRTVPMKEPPADLLFLPTRRSMQPENEEEEEEEGKEEEETNCLPLPASIGFTWFGFARSRCYWGRTRLVFGQPLKRKRWSIFYRVSPSFALYLVSLGKSIDHDSKWIRPIIWSVTLTKDSVILFINMGNKAYNHSIELVLDINFMDYLGQRITGSYQCSYKTKFQCVS